MRFDWEPRFGLDVVARVDALNLAANPDWRTVAMRNALPCRTSQHSSFSTGVTCSKTLEQNLEQHGAMTQGSSIVMPHRWAGQGLACRSNPRGKGPSLEATRRANGLPRLMVALAEFATVVAKSEVIREGKAVKLVGRENRCPDIGHYH
jgi:hypothetical protein